MDEHLHLPHALELRPTVICAVVQLYSCTVVQILWGQNGVGWTIEHNRRGEGAKQADQSVDNNTNNGCGEENKQKEHQ